MTQCVSLSQNLNQTQTDSLKISPAQVKNVYAGLKQLQQYKKGFVDCIESVNQLDSLIQQQNCDIIDFVAERRKQDESLRNLNKQLTDNAVEIQNIKNSKTAWYKHPILWSILGFVGGIYLMK